MMTGSEIYIVNVIQDAYVISKSKVNLWPGVKIKCCKETQFTDCDVSLTV